MDEAIIEKVGQDGEASNRMQRSEETVELQ
jgi:hypothetical protein